MRLRLVHQALVGSEVLAAGAVADLPPGVAARLLAEGAAERVGDVEEVVRQAVADHGATRTAARRVKRGG